VMGVDEQEWTAIEQQLAEDHLLVVRASDASHALAQASHSAPDLVILGQTDGPAGDLVATLRLARPTLPVLALTDTTGTQSDLAGAGPAVTDVLSRPFSPPMLRSRVRAWLARAAAEPVSGPSRARRTTSRKGRRLATREEISQALGAIPLFQSLHPDELDLLSARAMERFLGPGEILIRQGGRSDELFIILSGRAQVLQVSEGPSQTQRVLGELGPNEVVGEMAVLTGLPRSATVVALDPLRCLEISASEFLRLVETVPGLAGPLAKTLARRIYETDRRIERFAPDPLTGLLGRAAFEEQYSRLAALARRRHLEVQCVLLDITALKAVNDRFGHEAGDTVLRTVARALSETVRETDLIARYSGDEFVMLLVDADAAYIPSVLQRLHERVRRLGGADGVPAEIRCSYGIASSAVPTVTPGLLLQQADEDMQQRAASLVLYAPGDELRTEEDVDGDSDSGDVWVNRRRTPVVAPPLAGGPAAP
jgi:diguanylate cyclase (GGDEF)-like protein